MIEIMGLLANLFMKRRMDIERMVEKAEETKVRAGKWIVNERETIQNSTIDLEKYKRLRTYTDYAATFLFVLSLFGVILLFGGTGRISGDSMKDTYHNGDFFLYKTTIFAKPDYGDVVLIDPDKENYGENYGYVIKRVIAVSGDTIYAKDGTVYLNGKPIKEPYAKGTTGDFDEITVPKNHVFVMGDNREDSYDSRKVGTIHKKEIIGIVKKTLITK